MFHKEHKYTARLLCGAAAGTLVMFANIAHAEILPSIEIASQPLAKALGEFASQTKRAVLVTPELTRSRTSHSVSGATDPEAALIALLDGTGLTYRRDGDTFLIVSASAPQSGSAAGDGADGTVQALIVTAQKREENIQDVPIAMSAFTQEDLTRSQVTGGPDLITQVPNMTFTKTNFSSYSIQIRGIGTQAISATTDAAVAVAFNNTPFIRNRFFEQEFYDLQRVEVLRGPQGTLYGRNATAGVVNILSAKPKFTYEERLSADVGNYNSRRLEGMVNMPLVEDKAALRIAGAWTKRDGYDTNSITGSQIDGRDLWSTRVSLRIAPSDRIDANLIWEHFQEDDDRLRSGKQLCHTHEVTSVGGIPTTHYQVLDGNLFSGVQATFSQGCKPASLYSPDSFQTPNGISLPYYIPLGVIFVPTALDDPYLSRGQSHDLRVIESTVDPEYRAKSDLAELQLTFDLGAGLTLASETGYNADVVFSSEDYNRYNTAPGAWLQPDSLLTERPGVMSEGEFGGIFCDPQIGCADRLVAIDLSTAKSRQFSQEFRLSSDYDGRFNFSLGANFLRYDTEDKYYVFVNSLTIYAAMDPYALGPVPPYVAGQSDNHQCLPHGAIEPDFSLTQSIVGCVYIDPNPISSLNDLGHNYFLSKNPYKLISYAAFGEAYYNITDTLKLTGGLRWTVDKKEAPRIPSWLLGTDTVGYPVVETVRQEWSEPTGRIALDWKPDLSFTDQTLVYASYARGYKAGGANPPPAAIVCYCTAGAAVAAESVTHPKTFDAEFVNALELGAKNTLLDGRLTLNAAAFYYDYTGYQISQIVDRSATNLNFDAQVWGAELEADWHPLENLRLGFKGGYESTRVADGMKAVDLMDRTAGNPDWIVVRPFPTNPSSCILPVDLFVSTDATPRVVPLGYVGGGNPGGCELAYLHGLDPVTDAPYVDLTTVTGPIVEGPLSSLADHPGYAGWDPETAPNHGEGIYKDLSGNELPNAPHFTATITADYTVPLPSDWLMTLHTDLYYQSEAWTRIFNTEGYDKLKAYTNVNLAAIFTNEDAGWKVMGYVKNVFDKDNITGAFLNSDDSGLTTNVFLTEPRLYGLRVTKEWTGLPIWGLGPDGGGSRHAPGTPFPLTVEIGGQVQKFDAPYAAFSPFSGAFPAALDTVASLENKDLATGDARQVKLTWRPAGGRWSVSAAARYGRASNGIARQSTQGPDLVGCNPGADSVQYCSPTYADGRYFDLFNTIVRDLSQTSATDREQYTIADFMVGRDVGLGMLGVTRSTFAAGLRYAEFESTTQLTMEGVPDWQIPEYGVFYTPLSFHGIEAAATARREFSGAGPVLSWDGATRLLGDEEVGHIDLDWSLTGGVLFGKQKSGVRGQQTEIYYHGYYPDIPSEGDPVVSELGTHARTKSVTVPLLDLSVGVSYEIERLKVSTGYRWERYFNVLDGGYAEHESYNRTMDGPYFKIAVGFGG